jgi:hypothetical protein
VTLGDRRCRCRLLEQTMKGRGGCWWRGPGTLPTRRTKGRRWQSTRGRSTKRLASDQRVSRHTPPLADPLRTWWAVSAHQATAVLDQLARATLGKDKDGDGDDTRLLTPALNRHALAERILCHARTHARTDSRSARTHAGMRAHQIHSTHAYKRVMARAHTYTHPKPLLLYPAS